MDNILNEFKNVLIVLVVFLVLDVPMLTIINKDMYQNLLNNINNGATVETKTIIFSAIITYLLLAYGLYHFAIKPNSLYNAALFGLVVYGVYDFTNLATLAKYGFKEAIIDTIWGTVLCFLTTVVVKRLL